MCTNIKLYLFKLQGIFILHDSSFCNNLICNIKVLSTLKDAKKDCRHLTFQDASVWAARGGDRGTRLELITPQGQGREQGGEGTLGNQDLGETFVGGNLPQEEFV